MWQWPMDMEAEGSWRMHHLLPLWGLWRSWKIFSADPSAQAGKTAQSVEGRLSFASPLSAAVCRGESVVFVDLWHKRTAGGFL